MSYGRSTRTFKGCQSELLDAALTEAGDTDAYMVFGGTLCDRHANDRR